MQLTFKVAFSGNHSVFLRDDFCFNFYFVAIAIVALALASAIALAVFAIAVAVAAAVAVEQIAKDLLKPSNDLVTVGYDHIGNAGNGGQSNHDLCNNTKYFH